MILPELSRMIKVPGRTTGNQVTKQETVVEREKNRRSGQSLRSLSQKSECFHLRILLHVVKGPTYFKVYLRKYSKDFVKQLNYLTPPHHKLILKIGSPIILLRH